MRVGADAILPAEELSNFARARRRFLGNPAAVIGIVIVVSVVVAAILAPYIAPYPNHAGSFVDFRITPKGKQQQRSLPLRVIAPYIGLAGLTAAAMMFATDVAAAQGFYVFAMMNLSVYLSLTVLIVIRHAVENDLPLLPQSRGLWLATATGLAIFVAGGTQAGSHGLRGLEALSHGQTFVSFTETQFAVAGAGLGGGKTRIVKFHLRWNGFGRTSRDEQGA